MCKNRIKTEVSFLIVNITFTINEKQLILAKEWESPKRMDFFSVDFFQPYLLIEVVKSRLRFIQKKQKND